MQAHRLIRLLEFQAAMDDEVIEKAIEVEIAPGPGVVAGLLWTLVGRCIRDDQRSYLIATLWEDRDGMLAAVRDGDVAVYRPAFAPYLAHADVAILDVDAAWRWCGVDSLATVRLFRVADLALVAGGMPDERTPNDSPVRDERYGPPCLALSAGRDTERILLAGWPGTGQPPLGGPTPDDAAAVVVTVATMVRGGLGVEYEVALDQAVDTG